jgi:hypothetical protein
MMMTKKMRLRRWMIVFFSVQLVGLGCAWLQHAPSAASSALWGTGFVLLFPGDLLSAWMMEKLFWHSRLSLASTNVISAVLMVAINAIIWWLVLKAVKVIRARLFTHSGVPTPSTPKPTRS